MYGNIFQTRKGEWRFLTSLSRKPRKIRTFARRKPIRPIKQKMENTPNVFYMVAYKLYAIAPDGTKTLREEATLARPYQFITGVGLVLETFENRIKALRQGQKFDFTLSKDEAYGDRDEESVLDLPRSTFEVDGRFDKEQIYEGAIIPLQDSEGHRFPATVVSVGEKTVTVDLNYPLAGCALQYVGEVIEARPATADEVNGVLRMLRGEGCGCCGGSDGCDGCGGGCGDGEGCHHEGEGCHHGEHADGHEGCCGGHGSCHGHHHA